MPSPPQEKEKKKTPQGFHKTYFIILDVHGSCARARTQVGSIMRPAKEWADLSRGLNGTGHGGRLSHCLASRGELGRRAEGKKNSNTILLFSPASGEQNSPQGRSRRADPEARERPNTVCPRLSLGFFFLDPAENAGIVCFCGEHFANTNAKKRTSFVKDCHGGCLPLNYRTRV